MTRTGRLLDPRDLAGMLETPGDVWEAVEQMFGMIWALAGRLNPQDPAAAVAAAKRAFRDGIAISPGVMDEPQDEEDEG